MSDDIAPLLLPGLPPIAVVRKPIKRVWIRVKPPRGDVEISAPLRVTDRQIEEIALRRTEWILAARERLRKGVEEGDPEGSSSPISEKKGVVLLVWGERRQVTLSRGTKRGVELREGEIAVTLLPDDPVELRNRLLRKLLRQELAREIAPRMAHWEEKTGLRVHKWTIRSMTSRWGSCSVGTKEIRFAAELIRKPLSCLDYIVLHELIHLKIPTHGKRFWAEIDRYMPDGKERQRILHLPVSDSSRRIGVLK